jgi:ApaG protein
MNGMPKQVTRGIAISAKAHYVPEQSPPGQYGFVYGIEIENRGDQTAQLLRRHWIITDALGEVREVEGEGVVGQQPVLKPGQSFSYQSGSLIPTPVGTMKGTYQMVTESGAVFEVEIPEFVLSANPVLH